MTILNADTSLVLQSSYIDEVFANPGNYIKVEVTGDINCCTSGCGDTVNTLEIPLPQVLDGDKAEFTDEGLKIFPLFFGLTEFVDGVYSFTFKRFKEGETIIETNCFFVDVTYKCKVASLLKCLLEENRQRTSEKISTNAHLLHYALVNDSNCGCNCEEMCEAFKELRNLLNSVDPTITNDCGC